LLKRARDVPEPKLVGILGWGAAGKDKRIFYAVIEETDDARLFHGCADSGLFECRKHLLDVLGFCVRQEI
jgi:hypothetical protein